MTMSANELIYSFLLNFPNWEKFSKAVIPVLRCKLRAFSAGMTSKY